MTASAVLHERGVRAAQSVAVAGSVRWATRQHLRVLAYHDVKDVDVFREHLRYLTKTYRLVSGDDVERAVVAGEPLPPAALWITFDDGHPSVAQCAELLADFSVSACLFVCPSVVDSHTLFWWRIVDKAMEHGLLDGSLDDWGRQRRALKVASDADRRRWVSDVERRLSAALGEPLEQPQLRLEDMRTWVAAGHEIGNHTWDHPCLDRCSLEEQHRQVTSAHAWFAEHGVPVRFFAYPNGNWATGAEDALTRLGYAASFLFDHQLTKLSGKAHRLSRLRLDADAGLPRVRGIASGAHPLLFKLRRMP